MPRCGSTRLLTAAVVGEGGWVDLAQAVVFPYRQDDGA